MQCCDPIYIEKSFKEQDGVSIAKRIAMGRPAEKFVGFVPCGRCIHCMTRRRRAWQFRLGSELHAPDVTGAIFMTLTRTDEYNNKMRNSLSKKELQNLIKKVRNSGESFRYYAIGEYGPSTHRPHYHLLLYATGQSTKESVTQSFRYYYAEFKRYGQEWIRKQEHGFIAAAEVTPARVGYITHYHINPKTPPHVGSEPCFAIQSQGLGKCYIENPIILKEIALRKDYMIKDLQGNTMTLPPYYRKKYDIYKPLEPRKHPIFNREQYDYYMSLNDDDKRRYRLSFIDASERKKMEYNISVTQNTI